MAPEEVLGETRDSPEYGRVYGRSRLDFIQSQFLDFLYVISRTDGLNIRLILKTFPVVIFGKGGM